MMAQTRLLNALALTILLVRDTAAHSHDVELNPSLPRKPLDAILWAHIFMQMVAWGLLFPTGMVLGRVKSKWHVPVQGLGTCLAIAGYFLGHSHLGRQFRKTPHSYFAPWLNGLLAAQVVIGFYLRLHLKAGIHVRARPAISRLHGIIGICLPVFAWIQFMFGGIAALGFCEGDHLGQCLAHFIMGSAFIAYGIILVILLVAGQAWLRRTGRSQEFFDSAVIAAWGCVNTFTEHRWGSAWVHNDIQHTTMGVIWWCAGLLGIWLSRGPDGAPRRTLVPAVVLLLTGFAMSSHPQTLKVSAMTHSVFGYTLMAAAVTRIIEISIILKDAPSMDSGSLNSFQFLPPFLICASGFMFMGANEEQMLMLDGAHIDHVSWTLVLYSLAFFLFLYLHVLIHIYVTASKKQIRLDPEAPAVSEHSQSVGDDQDTLRNVEEFELDGLASDDDGDDENGTFLKKSGAQKAIS